MSAPVIPPGGTLLDTFKQSFTTVPIDAEKDNAISTQEFLDAAESLTTMFGMFSTWTYPLLFIYCVSLEMLTSFASLQMLLAPLPSPPSSPT